MKKYRILFIAPSFYGHLAPSLAIARELLMEGHTIGYATGTEAHSRLTKEGIHDLYPTDSFYDFQVKTSLSKSIFETMFKSVTRVSSETRKKCYLELIHAFESFKPDAAYIDTADFRAAIIAENFNVPFAHGSATTPTYFEKGIPPYGSGWNFNTPVINYLKMVHYFGIMGLLTVQFLFKHWRALRMLKANLRQKGAGFELKKKVNASLSPYLYLAYTTDKFEYPRKVFRPQMYYVGPSILEDDNKQQDFPWEKIDENRPLIYVASGTVYHKYYKELYKNIPQALSDENFSVPVQVVMALGKKEFIDELGVLPPNFIAVQYAPQLELLSRASVFITHGGAGSAAESLLYGIPMLVFHCGMDRVDVGKRVEYRGAGLCYSHKQASVKRIREAVLTILQNPSYSESARAIMESYKNCNGAKTSAGLILRLAETRKPVLRKQGSPITLEDISKLPNYLEKS